MTPVSEYHQYLFLGKVTETLSADEEIELNQLFAGNKDAESAYYDFVANLPAEDVNNSFERIRKAKFWESYLPQQIVKQKKRRRTGFILVGSMLIAGSASLFLWKQLYSDKLSGNTIAQNINTGIKLTLTDGTTVDLSNNKGEINAKELLLKNVEGKLSYSSTGGSSGINSLVVPVGMTYQIDLNDGSKVWMNAQTKLDFPSRFAEDKREITVDGEAYFEIAKDATKPFFVKLSNSTVAVTGTSFNVNTYDSIITKVSLVDGGLNLLTMNDPAKVSAGDQVIYNSQNQSLTRKPFDKRKTLSWRQGIFYFDRASLAEIIAVLYRWYGIISVVEREELYEKKFAGLLNKSEPVEVFLDNLQNITRIETVFDKKGILHFK